MTFRQNNNHQNDIQQINNHHKDRHQSHIVPFMQHDIYLNDIQQKEGVMEQRALKNVNNNLNMNNLLLLRHLVVKVLIHI